MSGNPKDPTAIKVFISYRRTDARGYAGWLEYVLEETLHRDYVFRDVDNLAAGEDFMEVIERFIRQCDAVLCVIGPDWAIAKSADGAPRLHAPNDPVRVELETAIRLKRPIIPVLVADAQMPAPDKLPESLAGLPRKNAVQLSDSDWKRGVTALLDQLHRKKAESGVRPKLPGLEIYERLKSGSQPPKWVGRNGGLTGSGMKEDLATGRWKEWTYEVRFTGAIPSNNWFPATKFAELIDGMTNP